MGRRVEALAEQNDRLAAGLAQAEAESKAQARERERLDQAMQRLRQVAGLSREINSLDLDLIERVSTEQLPALLGARAASLYLYDTVGDRLVLLRHTHGRPIAERVDLKDSPQSPMAVAVRRGELLLVSEFQEFERREEVVLDREFSQEYATSSCIVAPLKGGGRVRGVLNLADKVGGAPFDREIDLPVVEQIAELIGASIYNVELFQEMERRAKTDPLTDLANRRAVEDALDRETDRSRRYGSKLSVLLFDVDQLKRINDEFGHHVGDSVLQHVARVLAEAVRSVDVPGRWAGDEFLVVLPDTGAGQAGRLAKRLLVTLRDNPPQIQDQSIFSSLSAGVAEYKKNESVEDLVHRVDKAMYDAKKAGRDRIVTAD
jgi:diguanylate cyclase (GGDEF)-like protein